MCVDCNDNQDVFEEALGGINGKEYDVVGGESINVDRLDEVDKTTFTVSYVPYTPLVISSFSQELPLQLKGTEITSLLFNFTFNKTIQEATISSSGFVADHVVTPTNDTDYEDIEVASGNLVGGNITDTTSFTLVADDDTSDSNPSVSRATSLSFGNKIYIGQLISVDENTDDGTLVTLVQGLSSVITTDRSERFQCAGATEDTYEIFASPVSFGAVQFKDDDNPTFGGFYLINTVDIPNGNGFTEQYYVYRSTYGNLNGAWFTTS